MKAAHRQITIVGFFAQLNQSLLGAAVDVFHSQNLTVPFISVFLVYAERVAPKTDARKLMFQVTESRVEVGPDIHLGTIHSDNVDCSLGAPYIRESLVFMAACQGDFAQTETKLGALGWMGRLESKQAYLIGRIIQRTVDPRGHLVEKVG